MRNLLGPLAMMTVLFGFGCGDNDYWDCDFDGDFDEDIDEDWDEGFDHCDGPCPRPRPPAPVECVLSAECDAGERCVDGACEGLETPMTPMGPQEPEPSGCMADRECAGGECVRGMCHAACDEESPVCGTGHSCLEGICGDDTMPANECAVTSDCADGETCIDTRCFTGCESDTACTNPADFCDHGLCRPDWRPTTSCVYRTDCGEAHCVDGQCRDACWADSECGEGVCDGGFCAPSA